MAIEASSLVIKVESSGISQATEALNKLATAGDKAEKSAAKLSQSNKGAEASAKKQEALWYDLLDKASRYYERQFNAQQKALDRENKAAENAILREANAMNKAFDARIKAQERALQRELDNLLKQRERQEREEKASYAKLQREADRYNAQRIREAQKALDAETRAIKRQQDQIAAMRVQASAKAYADAQAEAIRMNRLRDQQLARDVAKAEKQRQLNATFSTASSGSRLSTVRQAAAYGALGGDVGARFGGEVAALANARGIAQLTAEHERLTQSANRSRGAIRNHTAGMSDAHAMARGLTGSLGALWLTYGNVVPLALGAAIGASFKAIISEGSKVENVLHAIGVRGGESEESVNGLRNAVLEIGKGVYGPLEVANAFQTLILAGQSAEEAMKTVKDALNLATVGGTSIEKSATTLVQVGTAMGFSAEGFSTVADVIAKTAAATMSDVESLSEAFKSASAVGKLYKVSLQDLATELGALSQLGIQGSAAGTSVKNFYKELSSMSDKTKNTLKDMGLKPSDFKDARGGFLDLITVVGKLNGGLSTLREDQRALAIQNLSNERGMKTAVEVLDMYNEKVGESSTALAELRKQIGESGGYASQGAARMALSAENQMKSTVNTLKTSFVEAFKEIEPQVTLVARALREAFSSEEFKNGIQSAAVALSNFGLLLVENIPTIVNIGKALIALKIATTIAAAFFSLAKAVDVVGKAMLAFEASTLGLGVALPALGVVLAAVAAAWSLYAFYKDQSFDDSKAKAADAQSKEFVENLEKENKRIAEANALMRKNVEGKKAMQVATQNLAVEELKTAHDRGIIDLEFQRDKAMAELPKEVRAQLSNPATMPKKSDIAQYQKVIDLQNAVGAAYAKKAAAIDRAEKAIAASRAIGDENAALNAEQQEAKAKEASERAKNAVGMLTVKPEKEETKRLNAIEQEKKELEKLAASYEAKNKAMVANFTSQYRIMAETQEAIVEVNREMGMYGSKDKSNPVYVDMLSRAKRADEGKFKNENNKKLEEFIVHLKEGIAGEEAFQKAAEQEGASFFGVQRRKAEYFIQNLKLSDEFAAKLREWADEEDRINKMQDARNKLITATGSSNARAQEAEDEADAMALYGAKAHATALEIAKAAIAKAKLTSAGDEAIVQQRIEAAALEQLNVAYRDLVKAQIDLDLELDKAQAESLTLFGQSEMEKVRIVADAQKKIADLKMAQAQEAFDEKALDGSATFTDVVKINQAQAAYKKTLETINKISNVKMGNILTKNEVDRWKALGRTIEDSLTKAFGKAGAAAGQMFNLFAQGQARDLAVTTQIGALKKAQLEDGKDRTIEIDQLQKESAQARLGEYAGMADAAKGFFDENSKGYEAMTKAATILHAAEVALSLIKGVNAILTQGEGDPYSAFARMAAMTAMVAALGVAVTGGGGGGMSVADQQATQGTGTVFGAEGRIKGNKVELVGQKSESITKSLSILERNSGLGLVQNNSMLSAMRSLANSIQELATQVVRNSGISNPDVHLNSNNGFATTVTSAILGGAIGTAIIKLVPGLNNIVGKIGTAIFGGKQTLENSGFSINKTSLANAMSGGVNAVKFADIKTSGGWFRSDKTSHNTESLGADVNAQFAKVFSSMHDTLVAAADSIGVGGQAFADRLNAFVIDVGNISLKGMTGEQIEKEIQAMFSKVGDQMATFAFSDMQQYQKVGEGLLETVARVANELMQVKDVFEVLGKSLPGGMAAVAQSQKLIKAFGDIDTLTSGVGGYMQNILTDEQRLAITTKSVHDRLTQLNLTSIKTKDQFKSLVDSLDLTKDADIELFKSLMELAPAFGEVTEAAKTATSDARQALTDAYERESQALKDAQGKMESFVKTLKNLSKASLLGDLSPLTPQQKYAEAKSQFETIAAAAKNGDEDAQAQFESAFNNFLEASKIANASGEQYQADFLYAQRLTQEATSWAQKQVDVAKATLDALNKQVEGLLTVNDSLLTVSEAINNLVKAMGGDTDTTAATNAKSAIEALYQGILGRSADAGGMEYWMNSVKNGHSISQIADAFKNSDEARGVTSITPITPVVSSAQSVTSADVIQALNTIKEAVSDSGEKTVAEVRQLIPALFESQDDAADKTVAGFSEAIKSTRVGKTYALEER